MAVDRFEPARGVAFARYAVPTMIGEMKRYCDLTRAETAAVLGLSQLDLARILRRALERLRTLQERQAG